MIKRPASFFSRIKVRKAQRNLTISIHMRLELDEHNKILSNRKDEFTQSLLACVRPFINWVLEWLSIDFWRSLGLLQVVQTIFHQTIHIGKERILIHSFCILTLGNLFKRHCTESICPRYCTANSENGHFQKLTGWILPYTISSLTIITLTIMSRENTTNWQVIHWQKRKNITNIAG